LPSEEQVATDILVGLGRQGTYICNQEIGLSFTNCYTDTTGGDVYDVVERFHQRNRAPRAPDTERLRRIRQDGERGASVLSFDLNRLHGADGSAGIPEGQLSTSQHTGQRPTGRRQCGANSGARSDDAKQLRYYPPQWRVVIEAAKMKLRTWIAVKFAFPLNTDQEFIRIVVTFLRDAKCEHEAAGNSLEHGEPATFACFGLSQMRR
jgi:hypothetical protein